MVDCKIILAIGKSIPAWSSADSIPIHRRTFCQRPITYHVPGIGTGFVEPETRFYSPLHFERRGFRLGLP